MSRKKASSSMTYHYNRYWHHKKICNCPQLTNALATKSTAGCYFWQLCVIYKRCSSFRSFHFTVSIHYLDAEGTTETEPTGTSRSSQDHENCLKYKHLSDVEGSPHKETIYCRRNTSTASPAHGSTMQKPAEVPPTWPMLCFQHKDQALPLYPQQHS